MTTLPKGILVGDTKYPKWDGKNRTVQTLTLYRTERFGWVVRTLLISRGTRGQPDRYYGIALSDQQIVSVGNGPHVKDTVEVWVMTKTQKRLQFLIDLHTKGMESAGNIRDRRSTRIANTKARRGAFDSWF